MIVYLKEIFENIVPKYRITLEEWNHNIDDLRCLFRSAPNTEISKFLNAYKSTNSKIIKKFPNIKNKLWKEYF